MSRTVSGLGYEQSSEKESVMDPVEGFQSDMNSLLFFEETSGGFGGLVIMLNE